MEMVRRFFFPFFRELTSLSNEGMSSPKGTNHARVETIEERLKAAAPEMDDADIRAVGAFVRHCVTIDPAVRPSASQLLEDEWFTATSH